MGRRAYSMRSISHKLRAYRPYITARVTLRIVRSAGFGVALSTRHMLAMIGYARILERGSPEAIPWPDQGWAFLQPRSLCEFNSAGGDKSIFLRICWLMDAIVL